MTKSSVYCDRCGCLIRNEDHGSLFAPPTCSRLGGEWLDFCDDCFFKVISFAKKAKAEEEAQ